MLQGLCSDACLNTPDCLYVEGPDYTCINWNFADVRIDLSLGVQVNVTDSNIGYLVMDLEKDLSHEVEAALRDLPTSIKTRILY